MASSSFGVTFSLPFEIAAVRPLRQTTFNEREEALRAAHYNTELLPQELIYVDLSTDSGVSSLSTYQLALLTGARPVEPGMGLAVEGSLSFAALAEEVQRFFGFPFLVATTQGRSAERIWTKLRVTPNTMVAGNMLFPSTRVHIEMNGAKIIDVISENAHDFRSADSFKGNVDVEKLEAAIREHGAEKMSCVYVELNVNSCGGHPVSLANLAEIRAIASRHKIPLFLDACRILENSFLIKEREPGFQSRSIQEIVRQTCALADGCTMSALKDFLVPAGGLILMRDRASYQKALMQSFLDGVQLPAGSMDLLAAALRDIFATDAYVTQRVRQVLHLWRRLDGGVPLVSPPGGHAVFIDVNAFLPHLTAEQFPAEALASFVYATSGVRLAKGPPLAPSQTARGANLLRLAVPARKYLLEHLDDVAEAILYAYANRRDIKGLKKIQDPTRSKYEPAHFSQR